MADTKLPIAVPTNVIGEPTVMPVVDPTVTALLVPVIVVDATVWLTDTVHDKPDPETMYVPAVTPVPVSNMPTVTVPADTEPMASAYPVMVLVSMVAVVGAVVAVARVTTGLACCSIPGQYCNFHHCIVEEAKGRK